jgi:bifunctional ADP-heptose synthase (sugar kinase/adenylyltransferase)
MLHIRHKQRCFLEPPQEAASAPSRQSSLFRVRTRVLAEFAVDAVVAFDDPTPRLELTVALRPDVIVKGGHLYDARSHRSE